MEARFSQSCMRTRICNRTPSLGPRHKTKLFGTQETRIISWLGNPTGVSSGNTNNFTNCSNNVPFT